MITDEDIPDIEVAFDQGYETGSYETRKALTDLIQAQAVWDRDHILDLIWSTSVDEDLD